MLIAAKATPFIAWSSLGEVLAISALFSIGIVIVLSISLRLFSLAATKSGGEKTASIAGGVICCLVIVAAVVFGIVAIVTK
jgi:hypothetical protein